MVTLHLRKKPQGGIPKKDLSSTLHSDHAVEDFWKTFITSRANFLVELPPEILSLIYAYLDHRSLNSLICACPAIQHHFLLVTGINRIRKPQLFTANGMRHISLSDFYRFPEKQKILVTLFEIGSYRNHFPLTERRKPRGYHYDIFSRLNSHSFIYIHDIAYGDISQWCKWRTMLLPNGAKILMEPSNRPNNDKGLSYGSMDFAFQNQFPAPTSNLDYQKLCTLEMHQASIISGLQLPLLEHLTIHFEGPSYTELSGVSAKKLTYLNISYTEHFPFLANLDLGGSANVSSHCKRHSGTSSHLLKCWGCLPVLELTKVDSLTSNPRHPLAKCSTPVSLIERSNFSFAVNFKVIHINGGHDTILTKINLTEVYSLSWRQTHEQVQTSRGPWLRMKTELYCTKMRRFFFETVLYYPDFPVLVSRNLSDIGIISHNSGLDLNGLWNNSSFYWLEILQVAVLKEQCLCGPDDFIFIKKEVLTNPLHRRQQAFNEVLELEVPRLQMVNLHGCIIDQELDRSVGTCNINYKTGFHCSRMGGTYKGIDNSESFGEMISLPYE